MATPGVPSGPFTYTAPGDLGDKRETMLINELLTRDKLALPKTRGFTLPAQGFVYGRPNDKRDFTVADALRWKGPVVESCKEKYTIRDYMALNRASVSTGLAKADEYYDYRTGHDIRRGFLTDKKPRTKRLPPGMVFGMPSRPSTPFFDVIEHRFQDRWIQQRYNQELAKKKFQKQKLKKLEEYRTRASMLRTYQNPVDEGPLWQLPRFANSAKPHLQTFRTSRSKENAFQNFDMDRAARKGVLGQGIYEAAKN